MHAAACLLKARLGCLILGLHLAALSGRLPRCPQLAAVLEVMVRSLVRDAQVCGGQAGACAGRSGRGAE